MQRSRGRPAQGTRSFCALRTAQQILQEPAHWRPSAIYRRSSSCKVRSEPRQSNHRRLQQRQGLEPHCLGTQTKVRSSGIEKDIRGRKQCLWLLMSRALSEARPHHVCITDASPNGEKRHQNEVQTRSTARWSTNQQRSNRSQCPGHHGRNIAKAGKQRVERHIFPSVSLSLLDEEGEIPQCISTTSCVLR